ncbi:MAG: putative glycoside hydrolase [Gemmatimonadaceae bacterium]
MSALGIFRSIAVLVALAACTQAAEHANPSGEKPSETSGVVATATRDTTKVETSAGEAAIPSKLDTAKSKEAVRALYVNRWATQSRRRMAKLLATADSTEINAFVLDMKDEFGLNYKSANADFQKNAGTASVAHVGPLLDTLKAHHILAIARIVVFKDSVTARVHPEWTIRKADGSIWRDKKGIAWVNPYHKELWAYNIGVAEELVKMGFGEVQFDYIRFPEPYPSLPKQVFPDAGTLSKPDALAAYLKEAKARLNALGVRSTADIFGLVASVNGALEVGQQWEKIAPNVDVVLPMVYPSHYPRGELGVAHPNAEPYKIIVTALGSARAKDKKLGITDPEHVRPWLQAFTLGPPAYGPEQLEAEKKAVYDAGYDGWVMWNPGSIYDVFTPALEKTFVSRKKK